MSLLLAEVKKNQLRNADVLPIPPLSTSPDHLRKIAKSEASQSLTNDLTPSLIDEIDKRFRGFQVGTQKLVSTANNVLSQVQLAFDQLRRSQLNNEISLGDTREMDSKQEHKLNKVMQEQGAHQSELHQSQADARFGFQV